MHVNKTKLQYFLCEQTCFKLHENAEKTCNIFKLLCIFWFCRTEDATPLHLGLQKLRDGWLVAWLSNYVWRRRKKEKNSFAKKLVAGSSWEAEKNPFKWLLKDVPSSTVNNEWITWHSSHENNKTKIKPYYQALFLKNIQYWLIIY